MCGGGVDIYQSPYKEIIDDLAVSMGVGAATGESIKPQPDLLGHSIASKMNGTYDARSGVITAPTGETYTIDPATGQVMSGGGGREWHTWVDENGETQGGYRGSEAGGPIAEGDPYYDLISTTQQDYQAKMDDPNAAWNQLGAAFSKRVYNPQTGQYEEPGDTPPPVLDFEYYKDKYGGYLDKEYTPTEYTQSQYTKADPYQQFDYQAPTVESLDPVVDSAWETMYNQRAGDTEARARGERQANIEWQARQGGSLGAGRKAGLDRDIGRTEQRDLDMARRDVEMQKAFQKYGDAQTVRDKQLDYDWQAQKKRGDEHRYGQDWGQEEHRYAEDTRMDESKYGQEWGRDEGHYAYEDAQKRGAAQMTAAEALDTKNRSQAYIESQGQKQDLANMLSYFNDMLKIYNRQDSTAASYDVGKGNQIASAFGGLLGAAGQIGSAGLKG